MNRAKNARLGYTGIGCVQISINFALFKNYYPTICECGIVHHPHYPVSSIYIVGTLTVTSSFYASHHAMLLMQWNFGMLYHGYLEATFRAPHQCDFLKPNTSREHAARDVPSHCGGGPGMSYAATFNSGQICQYRCMCYACISVTPEALLWIWSR